MKLYKTYVAIYALTILMSCGNSHKGNSFGDRDVQDSLSSKYDSLGVENEDASSIKLLKELYPNSNVVSLHPNGEYYSACPDGKEALVHLIRIKDGEIVSDKEFPHEYGDIDQFLLGRDYILIGINWSGQCKIVTLTKDLIPIDSRIYNYPDGEWTQLDSLSIVSDGSYYAEFRTNCGDCGEGINLYKVTADFHHVILTSSVEAIGEFRDSSN